MEVLELPGGVLLGWCALEGVTGHDAGRYLLSRLHMLRTGKEHPPIAVASRGKPYFTEGGLHFSISHTPRHAFCALGSSPLGIDAEELDRPIRDSVARRVLSSSETARWEAASDPHRALLRMWVLKEASAKLTGQGLQGFPNHTDFDPEDPRVTEIAGCCLAVLTEGE